MTRERGLQAKNDGQTTHAMNGGASFVVRALHAEYIQLRTVLTDRQLWLVLGFGLLLWSLAYQVPYSFTLNFGGDRATGRRYDDAQFITGWNDRPEPTDDVWLTTQREQMPFRWAYDQAILHLPGLGYGAWQVSLLAAGQPTDQPTSSIWSDGTISSTVDLGQQPRLYQHIFRSDPQGDLALRFVTPSYTPPGDPRPLGFVGFAAHVRSVGVHVPPLNQLAGLATLTLMLYTLSRRLGAHRHCSLVVSVALVGLSSLLLATWRLPLTSFAPALGWLALGCYPLTLVLLGLPWVWQGESVGDGVQSATRTAQKAVVALIVLGFAIRLGGMLHPHLIFSDIGLNANNLRGFADGAVYQTESLPARAGGGVSPYPIGQYIMAAPIALLAGPAERDAVRMVQLADILKITNALLDSVVIGLVWLLLTRLGYGHPAALFATALYLVPGPALKSFGVGEFANISGQALAMPLLVALPLLGPRLRDLRTFGFVAALMLLALLGHAGVAISVSALLVGLSVIWLANQATARQVPRFLLLGLIVAGLLCLGYYSAFLHLWLARDSTQSLQALPDLSFGAKLWNELRRAIFGFGAPTNPLLVGLAVVGFAVIVRTPAATRLVPLLIAWASSVVLTLGLLAVRDQTVRWDLFLYPALCIASGPLLAALWQRNQLGKAAALLLTGVIVAHGLGFWVGLIINQYHV